MEKEDKQITKEIMDCTNKLNSLILDASRMDIKIDVDTVVIGEIGSLFERTRLLIKCYKLLS